MDLGSRRAPRITRPRRQCVTDLEWPCHRDRNIAYCYLLRTSIFSSDRWEVFLFILIQHPSLCHFFSSSLRPSLSSRILLDIIRYKFSLIFSHEESRKKRYVWASKWSKRRMLSREISINRLSGRVSHQMACSFFLKRSIVTPAQLVNANHFTT